MKSALVTGSEGFIGKSLIKELKKNNIQVIELDKIYGKDITNWSDIESLPKIDVVFHLAALTFIPFCLRYPRETYETNILGTLNIIEYCRKFNAKLVYASSYVYGTPEYLPIDEKHPLKAENPYAESKIMAEKLCKAYHEDYNINIVILRPFNVYGPGQKSDFLIPFIIKQIKGNNKIQLKDPKPKRDFIYVKDMINAYLKVAEYTGFEIFNIGSGKSYSVKEIADKIVKIYKKEIDIEFTNERRKNEVMDCYADITKAVNILGWQPAINLDQGLKKIMQF